MHQTSVCQADVDLLLGSGGGCRHPLGKKIKSSIAPLTSGYFQTLWLTHRMANMRLANKTWLTWSWPRGAMLWFMWGWRPVHTFTDTRYWRIGPVTLSIYD